MSRTRRTLVAVGVALAGVGVTTGGGRESAAPPGRDRPGPDRQAAGGAGGPGRQDVEEEVRRRTAGPAGAGRLDRRGPGRRAPEGHPRRARRPRPRGRACTARSGCAPPRSSARRPRRWRARLDGLPPGYRADVAVIVVGGNDVTHRIPVATSAAQAWRRRWSGCGSRGPRSSSAPARTWARCGRCHSRCARWARGCRARLAGAQAEVTVRNGAHAVSLARVVGPFFITNPDEMFSLDRFHPSALGYKRTAKALLPSVLLALGHAQDVPFGHHAPAPGGGSPERRGPAG
ncbi:SGNH/GDSL hydrolase family protein [Nocardioides sp. W3-2-3]|uniref:GDSL-type esterase/lipase family protein n=1 Tax=Nocardioides convexus TaxID=2712224 RepID=UPI0024184B36|nr:GDSL-type esterase/lipase family protein [Nocardioides convexus]NHA00448.1 SGNH/GDSL hydrolase family protein [Nocardioides convexus]